MLGKDVANFFVSKGVYEVFGINRNINRKSSIKEYQCDLTDFKMLRKILNEIEPDIIINCAANVNVDSCEEDKTYAYKINAETPRILASYNPISTRFVQISTDSVFDGKGGNYSEEDRTNPLNYYAYTKLEGERLVLKENLDAIIIRTNIYGYHMPVGKSLVEWAALSLYKRQKISGFNDVYFNPLYTKRLAEIIYNLININFKGLINVGCKEKLNKYEFLIRLADVFSIDTSLIQSVSIDTVNFKAERPKNTTLNTQKLNDLINYDIRIDDDINALYKDYVKL